MKLLWLLVPPIVLFFLAPGLLAILAILAAALSFVFG